MQRKNVGDLVVRSGRMWKITGIYLGAVGQESVIGLEASDRTLPHVGEDAVAEMIVPEALVEGFVFSASEQQR